MKKELEVHISIIFLWLAMAIMVILLTWWVFGNSPTSNDLSLGVAVFSSVIGWLGVKLATRGQYDHNMQIYLLKDIRRNLK